jgi:hydroxymethylpyrimidine kinase/phosphomethylpyrimidine kinase/thiamine-phosphate diphosphorylase
MRLEAAFFSASAGPVAGGAPLATPSPSRRADLLVVDFDDTCTERDTIGPLLARIADAADAAGQKAAAAAGEGQGEESRAALVARLSANYASRYGELMQQLLPASSSSSPPPLPLTELLERLSDFDVEMNRVVERAGALSGADALAAGAAVVNGGNEDAPRLREGCARVLARAAAEGVPVHVVSVNWSAAMVAAILREGGVEGAIEVVPSSSPSSSSAAAAASSHRRPAVIVHANELAVGSDGLTTGLIDVRCECARDKARVFGEIEAAEEAATAEAANGSGNGNVNARPGTISAGKSAKVDAAQSLERLRAGVGGAINTNGATAATPQSPPHGPAPSSSSSNASVYVGDSLSDLPALLAADYGVVVGSNGTLRRVLAAYGIPLLPLCAAPAVRGSESSSGDNSRKPALFEAAGGWPEVEAFLFGPAPGLASAETLREDEQQQGETTGIDGLAPTAALPLRASSSSAAAFGRGAAVVASASAAAAAAETNTPSSPLAAAVAAAQAAASRRPAPPLVLTVAGSDSGGGAGVQADLKTFLARGCFGMSCVTALTAQNTAGVASVHVPPTEVLEAQLDAVLGDLGAAAIKTGMLPDGASVSAVAERVRRAHAAAAAARRPAPVLVVDPVLVTTSGHALATDGVASTLLRELFPLATVVTPNLDEAAVLLAAAEAAAAGESNSNQQKQEFGGALFKPRGPAIDSLEAMRDAAKRLHEVGRPRCVLLKGGHLAAAEAAAARQNGADADANASSSPLEAIDVLYDGRNFLELRAPYVRTGNTHGTGCTLAAAVAAELAQGRSVPDAVAAAKSYLTEALAASSELAFGGGPQRPFDHGTWLLRRGAVDEAGAAAMIVGGGGVCGPSSAAAAAAASALPARGAFQATGVSYNPCDLRVYAVTNPGLDARQGRTVAQSVAQAVAGGATIVQVRQKDCDGGVFLAAVRSALAVCRAAGVPLLVNDRVDVALAAGADGVHVGQADLPASAVRRIMGPRAIVGVSVKTPEEAVKAQADGADYLGTGAIFATGTKDSSVIGIEGLRKVCEAVDIPVVAIGGVGVANAAEVLRAAPPRKKRNGGSGGCAGLAVVSAIFGKEDATAAAAELRRAVEDAMREIEIGEEGEEDRKQQTG